MNNGNYRRGITVPGLTQRLAKKSISKENLRNIQIWCLANAKHENCDIVFEAKKIEGKPSIVRNRDRAHNPKVVVPDSELKATRELLSEMKAEANPLEQAGWVGIQVVSESDHEAALRAAQDAPSDGPAIV